MCCCNDTNSLIIDNPKNTLDNTHGKLGSVRKAVFGTITIVAIGIVFYKGANWAPNLRGANPATLIGHCGAIGCAHSLAIATCQGS